MAEHADAAKQRAIALYLSGLSTREVSAKLIGERGTYVSPQTVARWMRERGNSRPVGGLRFAEVGPEAPRLYEEGLNLDQIGRRWGVGKTTAAKRLREMGVKIRPSGSRFIHVLTEDKLRKLFIVHGMSVKAISKSAHCSPGTVYRLLQLHGIRRQGRRGSLRPGRSKRGV